MDNLFEKNVLALIEIIRWPLGLEVYQKFVVIFQHSLGHSVCLHQHLGSPADYKNTVQTKFFVISEFIPEQISE